MFPVPSGNRTGYRHFQAPAQQVCCLSSGFQLVFQGRAFPAQGSSSDFNKRKQVLAEGVQRGDRPGGSRVKLFPVEAVFSAVLRPRVNQHRIGRSRGFADGLQKIQALFLRIHQRHGNLRTGNCQNKAGKPGAGTDIDQAGNVLQQRRSEDGQAVEWALATIREEVKA